MRVHDVVLGCLAQAIPEGLVACGAGQAGIILAAWVDPATARRRVSTVAPFSGGSGGRRIKDGVDGTDSMIGHIKSAPIETVEIDTPVIVRRHSLEPDSFGHGKYRGGASIRFEVTVRLGLQDDVERLALVEQLVERRLERVRAVRLEPMSVGKQLARRRRNAGHVCQ